MSQRFRMISMVAMTILLLDVVVGSSTGKGTLLFGTAEAQTSTSLTRGPYLQLGTPNSIVVRWRTGAAADSRVIYGLQPGALTQTASSATSTTNHEVTLQGLTPATRYYYAVGTSSQILAGGTGGFPFTTSPPAGTARPTRVWVIGDAGTASSSQRSVRDAYSRFNQGGRTDLWLMLGDNAYSDGTDGQYQSAVFSMYPEMLRTAVVWPTLGNHDAHSADSGTQSGPYYSIFTLPKRGEAGGLASGTEAYYSFDYGNIHFICLDSADSNRSTSGAMLKWLQADLTATDQNWIIAYWHHPPYSKGSHNSDSESELVQMRQNALPILEQGGVDLVLSGHSHSYERSFLLDRHYGSSSSLTSAMKLDGGNGRVDGTGAYEKPSPGPAPHEGAVYVVAGSSGQTGGGSLNHPAMFVSFNTLGSVALD
ncbi:MAG TPA: metallophosphoesterase family protein, partial [Candidatus Cryosericum sp.]|nr:metallophosphoesterase family protein [Candidatus Cryosericum sp.]